MALSSPKSKAVRLSDIRIDGGTQQRVSINQEIVAEYAEAMKCGAKFPPVDLFFDGVVYWIADGFHRFHASRSAEIMDMLGNVRDGTVRDAILFSTGANGIHGLRLTNEDKRKAVGIMLNDKEWSAWSDSAIAKHCKVTHPFVGKIRKELEPKPKAAPPVTVTGTSKNTITNNEVKNEKSTESPFLEPKKEELQESFAPSDDELSATLKAENDQIDYIKKLLESDDPLAHALADVKKFKAAARIAEERFHGLQNEKNALIRQVKSLQAKLAKAGK